jgi:hypothetical protein
MPRQQAEDSKRGDLDNLVYVAAASGMLLIVFLFGLTVYGLWRNSEWNRIIFEKFSVIIGLPCAAATAFLIIAMFRSTEGKIKFRGLGFSFEGASGPIVMWVLCFLAIASAMKMLW